MFPSAVLCVLKMDNQGRSCELLWDQDVRLSGQQKHLIKLQQMQMYANKPLSINLSRFIGSLCESGLTPHPSRKLIIFFLL